MPPLSDRYPLPVLPSDAGGAPSRPWRSLAERQASPSTMGDGGEFLPGEDEAPQGIERRTLLQLAAASLAAAGLSGCFRPPAEKVMPYAQAPAGLTPGVPLHYATGLVLGGFTTGLVVESREGRPLKVEGNPAHPESRGRALAQEQASLLGLYDPDRARTARGPGGPTSREALLDFVRAWGSALGTGERLRLLVEPTASPLVQDLYARLQARFPSARLVPFGPAQAASLQGAQLAYGRPLQAQRALAAAEVVVALDADLLTERPGALRANRELAEARAASPSHRLHVAESAYSLTGAYADSRLRVRPSQVERLLRALAAELSTALSSVGLRAGAAPGGLSEPERAWVQAAAQDLLSARGRGLVAVGERHGATLHALAFALNEALGNTGHTVLLTEPLLQPAPDPGALARLVEELRAGQVDTLLVTAWNPVYAAPADLDLGSALALAPHALYLGLHEDETSARCAWFAPATHPFERWADGRALDGTASILQPLIAPLFPGCLDEVALLSALVGEPLDAHAQLQRLWRTRAGDAGFEAKWEGWLAEGVVPDTAAPATRAALEARALQPLLERPLPEPEPAGRLELALALDARVLDGRLANNAWLQELPDPLTQLTWDNAALLSPDTARRLGVEDGQHVRLSLPGRSVEVPALLAPGHAEDTVTLALGGGREGGEHVARGVGVNAYRLRTQAEPWFAAGLQLHPLSARSELAVRQLHGRMLERPIALQVPQEELERKPELLEGLREEKQHLYPSLTREGGYRWGMAIDLHRCTGCSACVVACQAENNIPSVGRDGVRRGREMHWLRIDRYFLGEESDPAVIHQPVMCVHCEYAPCEYVCPVNATVHSDEGLNEMVYNRCIGTRYCSNNCPYKVRRFNFLDYTPKGALARMHQNPEVSVRSRGVMEKCTYCVQRIERARIAARIDAGGRGRRIGRDEVRTACQQTCPTDAIVFGDLNDPEAEVSRRHADARHYRLLNELGTRPRTVHLVRVKHPTRRRT
ncbi:MULTISPECIES: 4Fe-4S dicluster domain-containing protein [Myxococcaceae]|uniref:4Fe-4S dicluster domain-containing protein n=1 Tax=Myxococcaceae TaxID=31 RepID=UPI0018909A0A|nr:MULTISPECIES: 4Fe-4S dicluster domain-containing protein [Myxococcaceae]MBF5046515.1 4Fe-4S dicluster domain-containing protein [Simulacricoccus sp. 17bor-14]